MTVLLEPHLSLLFACPPISLNWVKWFAAVAATFAKPMYCDFCFKMAEEFHRLCRQNSILTEDHTTVCMYQVWQVQNEELLPQGVPGAGLEGEAPEVLQQ